ncbi:DegT/DnrJ/EryC1/StrS family aminotransferase [Marinimicrobium sp. C6131]|uniref:DegT/DnrJ/EryC1/StrS family aminotransferase n=1 Tax=Marinimicrobium sp. C6131 TaxID=3022676 RepID=UPI00223E3F0D|nr:DegT/DnrJ/EryC1/StrS family aminotransferase [Marinimicrobium sp. C6131]UZJ43909.1 DegT/DnrJ/EryC1/StrS family aminotransferase [Marinimicrobium sp. C6131]
METFGSLVRGHLPPAGEKVLVGPASPAPASEATRFPGYLATWVDSGTSALALGLLDIARRQRREGRNEVIIPAYCCPDLVAAIHYAGLFPVAVDLAVDDCGYDLGSLTRALSDATCAVIAVNFLGLSDDLGALRSLLSHFPEVALIEDNAQWFPDASDNSRLTGDYVVFSFGRGKPVSLLGGGVLLHRKPLEASTPAPRSLSAAQRLRLRLKYAVYNQLLEPFYYQALSRNPLIKLGETRYSPLRSIEGMDDRRYSLLDRNIAQHRGRSRGAEQAYDQALGNVNALTGLFSDRRRRLLRYPLLVPDAIAQQRIMATLKGYGVTTLYQRSIDHFVNSGYLRKEGLCPNATDFASRLLTLPVHSRVTARHQALIISAILSELDPTG